LQLVRRSAARLSVVGATEARLVASERVRFRARREVARALLGVFPSCPLAG
jgi:hypothetical protein